MFVLNSPLRKRVAASTRKRPETSVPPAVQEAAGKIKKVSFNWAKLIARIYETNPLVCQCGKEIKITAFVLHSAEIRRVLSRIGWPTENPEFDPYAACGILIRPTIFLTGTSVSCYHGQKMDSPRMKFKSKEKKDPIPHS